MSLDVWNEGDRLGVERILRDGGDKDGQAQRILDVLAVRVALWQLCHDMDHMAIQELRERSERLDQIATIHRSTDGQRCDWCGSDWPCVTGGLALGLVQ